MKCEKCGKKIEHNSYKKVKGKYYHLGCGPEKQPKTQIEKAVEEIQQYGTIGFTEKPKRKRKVGKHKKTSIKKGD